MRRSPAKSGSGRSDPAGEGWIFRAGARSTTISPDRDTVWAFDLEGRPLSGYSAGTVYKRSLSSEVWTRRRVAGRRRYRRLTAGQAAGWFERVRDAVAAAPLGGATGEAARRVERIVGWTPERLLAERERFERVYRPVSILPPDRYLSVVLQATFGCTWNRCTFCSFYQDRPFSVRDEADFTEHAAGVRELLGEAAPLRRSLFLADGNALTLSEARLLPLLEIAREAFPGRSSSGFVDVFTGERRSTESWARLRSAGLRRVHVGLETGDDALLAWLNKPGGAREALEFVGRLEAAGLSVAVIFLVGVGGARHAADHVQRTLELASELPLRPGDVAYLSPFRPEPGSEYSRRAAAEGVAALDEQALDAQYAQLRDGIRRARPGVRVSRYEIREFVY